MTDKAPQKHLTTEEENLEDIHLVKQSQEGDSKAFDKLVLKYNKRIYALVYHMTQDREDSYDLLQDIFTKAYRSIKKFKGKSSFYTWIYTISVNMTINHLKKKKKRANISLDDEDLALTNNSSVNEVTSNSDPRREVDLKTLQIKLNEALKKLSKEHRIVVTLFDIQGVPHAQISKILGVSEGTVRSRLFYAHRNLQSHLEEIKKNF